MTKIYVEAEKGVDLLWGNKFNEAEELFLVRAATNPRHALHYSEVIVELLILKQLN